MNSSLSESCPLMLCPFCRRNIPFLAIYPTPTGQMDLCLKCSCLNEKKMMRLRQFIQKLSEEKPKPQCQKHSTKAAKFCTQCSHWLCSECIKAHLQFAVNHVFTDQEVNVQCAQHKKPFAFYCRHCKVNVCEQCKSSHSKSHKLMRLLPIEPREPQWKHFDRIKTMNQQSSSSFFAKIEGNKKFAELKKDIQSAMTSNEAINADLILLNQIIFCTSVLLKNFPLYELKMLQEVIVVNTEEFQGKDLSVDEEGKKLKEHLLMNYVLTSKKPIIVSIDTLKGHSNSVWCLAELSDDLIASGSQDTTIKLWDLTTKECRGTLDGHSDSVWCLVLLTEGRLASGSADCTIRLWNTMSNVCTATLTGHTDSICSLIELADGRLASCSSDRSIKLWSLTTNACNATFIGHSD